MAVVGVALAVALVTGIDVANHSANQAFRNSVEQVAGRATHQIEGGPGGLREAVYRDLRVETGLRASAPVVEGTVSTSPPMPVSSVINDDPLARQRSPTTSPPLRLLGIDPFADEPVRALATTSTLGDIGDFLTRPGAVLLGEPLAARLAVTLDDTFTVWAVRGPGPAVASTFTVVGLLRPRDARETQILDDLLVVDVASAQEVLGMVGFLSRIDVVLPLDGGTNGTTSHPAAFDAETLRAALPADVDLVAREQRAGSLAQMTRAFRLNLTALSLLALVVGGFLIYNASAFSVVRRRALLGILRAMGVSCRQGFGARA